MLVEFNLTAFHVQSSIQYLNFLQTHDIINSLNSYNKAVYKSA